MNRNTYQENFILCVQVWSRKAEGSKQQSKRTVPEFSQNPSQTSRGTAEKMENFPIQPIIAILFSAAIAIRSFRRKSLDLSGAFAGFAVLTIHFGVGYRFTLILQYSFSVWLLRIFQSFFFLFETGIMVAKHLWGFQFECVFLWFCVSDQTDCCWSFCLDFWVF